MIMQKRKRLSAQSGAVLIESAISVGLMAIVVLGFAQLYAITHYQLDHVKVATEMLMGPQSRSLQYDSVSRTFELLDSNSTPTLQGFMDTLGNFFLSRANEGDVLHMTMMYVQVNNATGMPRQTVGAGGAGGTSNVFMYPNTASGDCAGAGLQSQLTAYGTDHITRLSGYRNPASGNAVEIGTKLYDISMGGSRFKEYVDYIPVVYLLICSEPYEALFPQTAVSLFEFVPRRLVN